MADDHQAQAQAPPKSLHVVFLPLYVTSHMIPLVNIARLFAARGVRATIITTHYNALLFQPSVDLAVYSGHPISVRTLNFPSSEVGLREGIENLSAITSSEMTPKIYEAFTLLQNPIEQLIRSLRPDCIFSDMGFPWTADLAAQLDIPRLLFYPFGFLYPSIVHNLKLYAPHEKVQSETESFIVPFLPGDHEIEMKRCQLQEHLKRKTPYGEMVVNDIIKSEIRSYGLVHFTFHELEPAFADYYRNVVKSGIKIWSIGPLSENWCRGNVSPPPIIRRHATLSWLDTRVANSVLYVCFGSVVRFPEAQLTEIALALEESNKYFIWVVRNKNDKECDDCRWLPEGFEERNKDKGLILREWVPQTEILGHPAVSGFMTHCGWNSLLEAMTTGVPLITWPLWAEQFYNEKLVVEILGVGVPVGSELWNAGFEVTGPVVRKEKIGAGIRRLMEEGERLRRAAKEVAGKAKKAVEERGSSYCDLMALIEDLKACASHKKYSCKINTKTT